MWAFTFVIKTNLMFSCFCIQYGGLFGERVQMGLLANDPLRHDQEERVLVL